MSAETTPAIERADAAVRAAWGGQHHTTEVRFTFYAPPVRRGGATDALILLAVTTALAAGVNAAEMSRVLAAHQRVVGPHGLTRHCTCGVDLTPIGELTDHQAEVLRASIVGTDQ